MAGNRERLYALRIKGNSMIDALIRDGDMVVLEAQESAEAGEMVAAWLVDEEEATLKRFFPRGRAKSACSLKTPRWNPSTWTPETCRSRAGS